MQFHMFDLHSHTPFSDGQYDIDSVLQFFIKNKIEIVGFTDHIFPGEKCFSKDRLIYRKKVLRAYEKKYPQIRILVGGEINLYPHGALTLPPGIDPSHFDYLTIAKHQTFPKQLNVFKKFPRYEVWLWRHDPGLRLNKELWFGGSTPHLNNINQTFLPIPNGMLQNG